MLNTSTLVIVWSGFGNSMKSPAGRLEFLSLWSLVLWSFCIPRQDKDVLASFKQVACSHQCRSHAEHTSEHFWCSVVASASRFRSAAWSCFIDPHWNTPPAVAFSSSLSCLSIRNSSVIGWHKMDSAAPCNSEAPEKWCGCHSNSMHKDLLVTQLLFVFLLTFWRCWLYRVQVPYVLLLLYRDQPLVIHQRANKCDVPSGRKRGMQWKKIS